MAAVCLYFQIHQPFRLRRYSVFDTDRHYFDDLKNGEIIRKIATKCYLPTNKIILEAIHRHKGNFRVSYSISGAALEQLQQYAPEVIESFQQLNHTGCVEFLAETYYHSLAFLFNRDEFRDQVKMHTDLIRRLFAQEPRVFRHTELIYNNDLALYVSHLGFQGMLAEGVDQILGSRSNAVLYRPPGASRLKVLLRNHQLSDAISFRFSNKSWEHYPLTVGKFLGFVKKIGGNDQLCNLFMDYETFGEHQWSDSGIFEFLSQLPDALLKDSANIFLTPGQVISQHNAAADLDVPHMTSWADTERDLTAWLGNAMQTNSLQELYKLEQAIKVRNDEQLLMDWRQLTSSDHFYYMCTKYWADGDVHKYFSPYESPYDSYINFMNVLDNVRIRLR